jgi:hypothetical protein
MIDVLTILPGTKLKLVGNRIAEVVENMQDGQWLMVRTLGAPDTPSEIGQEELCHAQDILGIVHSGPLES